MTTLIEIAEAVRKHAPGALPVISEEGGRICMIESSGRGEYAANWHVPLPDDIARHVLIAAMVMDAVLRRDWFIRDGDLDGDTKTEYWWYAYNPTIDDGMDFPDADYGGDPLLSLYAAWRWAKGIQ